MTLATNENKNTDNCGERSPAEAPLDEDFDTILAHIGIGKWNVIYYIAFAYWHLILPSHSLAGAFLSPPINHTCHPPLLTSPPTTVVLSNDNTAAQNDTTYTMDSLILHDASCGYLVQNLTTGRLEEFPCTKWDFDTSTFSSTVTSEFSLVCERRYLRVAHQSIFMSGVMVGALFSGFLADRYGRLRMIAISATAYTVLALISSWLPSLEFVLAFRFLLGIMQPFSVTSAYTLVMEVTEIKWRSTAVGLVTVTPWSVGIILWGLLAYLERDWRWLETYVSLLLPLTLPFLFFMSESPRWLAVTGRQEEAVAVLRRAARMNGTSLPPTDHLLAIINRVSDRSTANGTSQRPGGVARRVLKQITVLFSTRKLITITVASSISSCLVFMIYIGLSLAASALNISDPFIYMSITGMAELPSVLNIFMLEKFGRKKSGIGTLTVCAISLLMQPVIPTSLKWLSMTLVMIGKMAASCAWAIVFFYTSELYPTEIRNQGLSVSLLWSRFGAFIAPFIISAMEAHHAWAIPVVFGLMAAVAAVSLAPLWETANTCLPDTIAQLEAKKECTSQQTEG